MKRFILLLVVVIAVASCKKDLIAYNAVEGKWLETKTTTTYTPPGSSFPDQVDTTEKMTLDFNTKTTGLSNTARGNFKYSLQQGTLDFYGERGAASWKITTTGSTSLTLSRSVSGNGVTGETIKYFVKVD